MRILFDLLHPAHVHVFRNVIADLRDRGDEVLVVARDKDVTIDLLLAYGIEHTVISEQSPGTLSLAAEWAGRTTQLTRLARAFRPDVLVGIMGVSIAPVGRMLRIPALVFYDTEFAGTNRLVYPLATVVVTPDSYNATVRGRHVVYAGYHELAYLHPDRFLADPQKLEAFGLVSGEPYSVVRFVSWEASHDRREIALSAAEKRRVVDTLGTRGRVVVSSEGAVPSALRERVVNGPVADMHDVLAHASVVVGESATMAAEAAVLGVPAVYIAKTSRGYIDDLEARYGLVRWFTPDRFEEALVAATEMAAADRSRFQEARARLLTERQDVSTVILGLIDRYGREA